MFHHVLGHGNVDAGIVHPVKSADADDHCFINMRIGQDHRVNIRANDFACMAFEMHVRRRAPSRADVEKCLGLAQALKNDFAETNCVPSVSMLGIPALIEFLD